VYSRVGRIEKEIRVIGDIIVVSVKEALPNAKIKKGDVKKGGHCQNGPKKFVALTDLTSSLMITRGC
jgi:hypothetical protein